ncbi:MAG: hypothetical protein HY313_09145 [Acidobacteria bacterium]|nr:hypothetical protein [Acidobacteriota bacterium]
MRRTSLWNERAGGAAYGGNDVQEAIGAHATNSLHGGLGLGRSPGPTLRSVRRMTNVLEAFHEISRKPGCDGVPWEAFANAWAYCLWDLRFFEEYGLHPMLEIQGSMAFGGLPDPVKEITIGNRVVQWGTVANRIVQRAVMRKAAVNLDAHLSNCSYAYRPGRSAATAIQRVQHDIRRGFRWALKTDIASFFDSVNREILVGQLRDTIADEYLCDLIMEQISPMVYRLDGGSSFQKTGLPQGSALSPFLANIYLHQFDRACSSANGYFRYADDILIVGKTKTEVVRAKASIKRRLSRLGLKLNAEKTFICDLYREPVVFLGYEIRGGNIYPPQKAIERLEQNLKFRGQPEDRLNLMKSFVQRHRIGPVRKLFRQVDRRLRQLYPPGVTLVGLLDTANASTATQREDDQRREEHGRGGLGRRGSISITHISGSPAGEAEHGD